MRTRVITALVLGAIAAVVLFFRGILLYAAVAVLLLGAQYELTKAFAHKDIRIHMWPVMASGLGVLITEYFLGFEVALIAFTVFMLASFAVFMLIQSNTFDSLIYSGFAMLYPGIPALCIASLGGSDVQLKVAWLVGAVVAAVGSDTFAFFVGSLIGKHKLCPHLSPKKSIEGAIGGLVGGVAFVFAANFVLGMFWGTPPFAWSAVVLVGLVGAASATVGDLFASSIKRYCGVKDFSSFLPGHGGILDRLDGIFFSGFALFLIYSFINLL